MNQLQIKSNVFHGTKQVHVFYYAEDGLLVHCKALDAEYAKQCCFRKNVSLVHDKIHVHVSQCMSGACMFPISIPLTIFNFRLKI